MEEAKRPYVKSFSCPNCAGSVNIRAIGSSINVVCHYCSSIIDTNDENYKVVDTFTNKIKRRQVIGLGERGELFGTLWEVIGYMERVEQSGTYTWSEYLLFNPLKGFRWLTEYAGHWSFVTTVKDNPELHPPVGNLKGTTLINPDYAWFKNRQYSLFSSGTAKVTFVIGEFYWQVRIGETVNMQEFIAPPETLTLEKNSEEINWSVGFYTNADTIKTAFRVETMPFQNGIAPNQPSPLGEEIVTKVKKYWKYFSYAILLIQIGFCLGTKTEVVYKGQMEFTPYDTQKTKVTPPFEIKDSTTTLEISYTSPVSNSWLEIGTDLVNDENGDTVEFEQGIEYYSGTDSDGAWSEGSTSTSEKLPSISKGKYHLNVEVSGPTLAKAANDSSSPPVTPAPVVVNIEVKTGGLLWSNFFFALFLVSIYPIYIYWKSRRFEVARWSESDFSPYASYDSGEGDDE